jgi:hypothetical protein
MIATPRFVFLHLHKSGGTFANDCLLRFVPGARRLGYHLPRSAIPAELAALPVLGLVRNPWSYYVSWYSFQAALPQQNALFRTLSEHGRLDFKGTISRMVQLAVSPQMLESVVQSLPAHDTNRGLNLPGFVLNRIAGTGMGFYAFLHAYMFGAPDAALHVGRMETLRTELPRLLRAVGEHVGPEMLAHIASAAPSNTSTHDNYASYYDDELHGLVAQRDREVIERYGYRFGA